MQQTRLVSSASYVPSIGSTNAALLGRPAPPGTLLIADEQTAGRGRRGRSWYAPPGTSLMFSLAVELRLDAASRSLVTLAAGAALIQAIREALDPVTPRVGLKWPNDLLIGEAKAAGILTESQDELIVIGVGINVDWRDVDPPPAIQATSLAEAAGQDVDRWDLLGRLVTRLDAELEELERDPGGVVPRYVPSCVTIGRTVSATVGDRSMTGRAVGVTTAGHLQLSLADGRRVTVTAGEVTHIRPAGHPDERA